MRTRIAMVTALVVLLSTLAMTSSATPAHAEDRWIEWQMLSYLNGARGGAGLPPLTMSRDIQAGAQAWSDQMAAANSLGHNPNAWGQIGAAAPQWTAMGENVGTGWNVAEIHNALMASPSHRNQILGNYNYVGIGATVRDGRVFLTQDFVRNDGWLPPAAVPDFSQASDNDLVRNPASGAVYLIEGGAKFWIRDPAAFAAAGYSWASVRDLSPRVLDAVPDTPRDGSLLAQRGDNSVFLIQGGAKFWVPSPYEFDALGLNWNAVQIVPSGGMGQVPDVPRDGALLAQRGDPRVFLIRGDAKAWIPDEATFERAGYNWSWVGIVPAGSLDWLRDVSY